METQDNGSVLDTEAVETQGKGSVCLTRKTIATGMSSRMYALSWTLMHSDFVMMFTFSLRLHQRCVQHGGSPDSHRGNATKGEREDREAAIRAVEPQ